MRNRTCEILRVQLLCKSMVAEVYIYYDIICIINFYNSENNVKPSLEVEMHMTINLKYLGVAFEQ